MLKAILEPPAARHRVIVKNAHIFAFQTRRHQESGNDSKIMVADDLSDTVGVAELQTLLATHEAKELGWLVVPEHHFMRRNRLLQDTLHLLLEKVRPSIGSEDD